MSRAGRGQIALEVDGVPWRIVPDDVVVRVGLRTGTALDRALLRELRRELRRAEAFRKAGRTLARRDVSEATLRARLRRSGVAPAAVEEATEALRGAGALDDARFASARARSLAERGWGDEAIVARLEGEGIVEHAAREALAGLEPEFERAPRVSAGLPPRKAAALLQRRGFDADVVESVLPGLDAGP